MQYDSRANKRTLSAVKTSSPATTSSTIVTNNKSIPLPPQISSKSLTQLPPPNIKIEQSLDIIGDEGAMNVVDPADNNENISTEINDVLRMDDSDDNDEPALQIDTTIRKSAYMTEKSSKKKMIKDGKVK